MNKKSRTYNNGHRYDEGSVLKNSFSKQNLGDTLGTVGTGLMGITDSAMKNAQIADTTALESDINNTANATVLANTNEDLLNAFATRENIDKVSFADMRGSTGAEQAMNTINGVISGATTGADVGGPWGALAGAVVGLGAGLTGIGVGHAKALKQQKRINGLIGSANVRNLQAFNQRAQDIDKMTDLANQAITAACGGKLNKKYAQGGNMHTNGSIFSNGLSWINNGGTHEQNPLEGVPMGIAPDGMPNLVEQDEVVYKDFVFSNRIKVPKNLRDKYKLKDDITFAEAAKKLSRESEERPNDPISMKTLDGFMGELAESQETIKSEREARKARKQLNQMSDEDILALTQQQQMQEQAAQEQQMQQEQMAQQQMSPEEQMMMEQQAMQQPVMAAYGGRLFKCGGHKFPKGGTKKTVADWLEGSDNYADPYIDNLLLTSQPEFSMDTYIKQLKRGIKLPTKLKVSDDGNLTTSRVEVPEAQKVGDVSYSTFQAGPFTKNVTAIYTNPTQTITPEFLSNLDKKAKEWDKSDQAKQLRANSVKEENDSINSDSTKRLNTFSRYAPIIGSAIGTLGSIFEKPDYTNPNIIRRASQIQPQRVAFNPVSDYMTYRPLDRNYYSNQARSANAATQRAIMDQSGGNAATARAALVGTDYNFINGLGALNRQAEESNLGQRKDVTVHNAGINQYNSTGAYQASAANASNALNAAQLRLTGAEREAVMRSAIEDSHSQTRNANMTNLFDNLGNLGKENFIFNQINSNKALSYNTDRSGVSSYKGIDQYKGLSDNALTQMGFTANDIATIRGFKKGGYLTIKNKRRRK